MASVVCRSQPLARTISQSVGSLSLGRAGELGFGGGEAVIVRHGYVRSTIHTTYVS